MQLDGSRNAGHSLSKEVHSRDGIALRLLLTLPNARVVRIFLPEKDRVVRKHVAAREQVFAFGQREPGFKDGSLQIVDGNVQIFAEQRPKKVLVGGQLNRPLAGKTFAFAVRQEQRSQFLFAGLDQRAAGELVLPVSAQRRRAQRLKMLRPDLLFFLLDVLREQALLH